MIKEKFEAIIVGAGVIGLSIAWRASQLGLRVLVLERHPEPAGASWVAAGMLAPITETAFGEQAMLDLNLQSLARYPSFLGELAAVTGIHLAAETAGTLFVSLDPDQRQALRRLFDYQKSLGLEVEWLQASQCRRLEPSLHPAAGSAISARADWAVDPRALLQALQAAASANGADLRYGEQAAAISTQPEPAVQLASGDWIHADKIVLAAGAWSQLIDGVPPYIQQVLRPVKGQILRLKPAAGEPRLVHHVVRTEDVYIVPRQTGELVVGATVEEKGFDLRLTAGGVLELLRAADEVLPGIRELELTECSVSLRPGTADNGPLLGYWDPHLIAATGHYRNGVLLAPVTADAITELLVKDSEPPEIASFSPLRFAA